MRFAPPPASPLPPTSSRRRTILQLIDIAIEVLLYGLLVFLPAAYGAVDAWSECIAFWMGGALALALVVRTFFAPARFDRVATMIVALYLALATSALIPVPRSAMQTLSPATADTRSELLGDLPDATTALARMPISFYALATRHDLRIVLLAVTVLAAVMIAFRDVARMKRLLLTISLIGLAAAGLALAQDITGTHAIYWHTSLSRLAARGGPFVNHSHFSQFMNLSMGAALGLMLVTGGRRDAASQDASNTNWTRLFVLSLAAFTIILGLLTIALSFSRGGVISIAVAGTFTLLVLLSRKSLRGLAGVLVGLVIVALVALTVLGFERVAQRMSNLDLFGRLQMVQDTRQIIRRFPLTGIGLGNFEWVFPAYNHIDVAGTASHLENEYMQAAAEMGIPGLLVVLAFVAWVWRRYFAAIRAGHVAAIGLGYGLLAVMVHSLSDYGQHLPAIACLSATTCGIILNLGRTQPTENSAGDHSAGRHVLVAAIALPIVLLIAGWAIRDGERTRLAERYWNIASGYDTPDAQFGEWIRRAADAEPGNVHHLYWLKVYEWRTSRRTAADAAQIIPQLNAARKLCPTYAPLYSVLGQIEYAVMNAPAAAVTHLHLAAKLDPADPTTCFLAGRVDAKRGDFDSAVPLLRQAVHLDYTVMYDVNDLALRQLHRPELAIRVAGDSYYRLFQLRNAMYESDEYRAQGTAVHERGMDLLQRDAEQPGAKPELGAQWGMYRLGQGRFADAERALGRALQSNPGNVSWQIAHADALAGMGRMEDAMTEVRAILQANPNDAAAKELVERLDRQQRQQHQP